MARREHGTGSLLRVQYKDAMGETRETKTWYLQFYLNGRRIRESAKTENKHEAQRRLTRRLAEVGAGGAPADPKLKYKTVRDAWLTYTTQARSAAFRIYAGRRLGVFDKKTRRYSGLRPHDLRRSAVKNMIRVGVPRNIAMQISGHKTESVFNRYHIIETSDVRDALVKAGKHDKLGKEKSL